MPNAILLVGWLPAEDEAGTDDRVRTVIGADAYTLSLSETVDACLERARSSEERAEELQRSEAARVPAVA